MADFYQTGVLTTLHRLKDNQIERLELELERFARNRPIGLVLPSLYSEFETPAMQVIVPILKKVQCLERIVLALGRANREQYLRAKSFFNGFYTPVTMLWMESPRIQALLAHAAREGIICRQRWQGPILLARLRLPAGRSGLRRHRPSRL